MIKKYTKDGQTFIKAGGHVVLDGVNYYCVSEQWLVQHDYLLYREVREDGEDGKVGKWWVHYLGAPYVAPAPVAEETATVTETVVYTPTYEELVVQKIRLKYSVDEELAILRQRDTKPEEFNEYFLYCEQCKTEAKEETEAQDESETNDNEVSASADE